MADSPEDPLKELSESVGAAEEVDWAEASEAADQGEDQEALKALQLIAEIQKAHLQVEVEEDEVPFLARLPKTGVVTENRPTGAVGSWGTLRLKEKIGEGATAEIFRAWDPRLEREGAVKLLLPNATRGPSRLEAVLREARFLVRVSSPNTVRVFSVDEHDGRVGIWMELIRGRSLFEVVQERGPLSAREAALIGIDLCRALAAVHSKGVVHRDVKAQNVMREEGGRIVLMDFGIGHDFGQGGLVASSGTPLYLAPEIFQGAAASPQSDLYALGVLLFFLVTGNYPVTGTSIQELRQAHQHRRRRLLRDLRPDLPGEFVEAVEMALAPEPGGRFHSAGEMERVLSGPITGIDRLVSTGARPLWRSRRGWLAASLLLASVLLVWQLSKSLSPPGADELRLKDLRSELVLDSASSVQAPVVAVAGFINESDQPALDSLLMAIFRNVLLQGIDLVVMPELQVRANFAAARNPEAPETGGADPPHRGCHVEGADICLDGTVTAIGDEYHLSIGIAHQQDWPSRRTISRRIPRRAPVEAAVDFFRDVRSELPSKEIEVGSLSPLKAALDVRPEALERYALAIGRHQSGELGQAVRFLEEAIELEPDFALAHCELAIYLNGMSSQGRAYQAIKEAFRLKDDVPFFLERYIRALYHLYSSQFRHAADSFELVVARSPIDATAHRQLALLYEKLGEFEKSLYHARRARELLPTDAINQGLVAVLLAAFELPEDALMDLEEVREGFAGDQTYFDWGEGLARLVRGEAGKAREAFERLSDGGPRFQSFGELLQAQAAVLEGRLGDAESVLLGGLQRDLRMGWTRNVIMRRSFLAEIHWLLGEEAEARRHLRSAHDLAQGPVFLRNLQLVGTLYSKLEDIEGLGNVLDDVRRIHAAVPGELSTRTRLQLEAELAWLEGDLVDAEEKFRQLGNGVEEPIVLESVVRYLLAEDRCKEAVPHLERLVELKGRIARSYFLDVWRSAEQHLQGCRGY